MALHRVATLTGELPLHGTAATRAREAAAMAQLPPHTLMQRAGAALGRLALALAPHGPAFEVFAGPGNNGGDGLVAATWLHLRGQRVRVHRLGDAARLPADAADALARARAAGVPIVDGLGPPSDAPAVAIDALLGLGLRREPDGTLAEAIVRCNTTGALRLAADLPSGLDADRGQPLGDAVVRATHTLSLLSLKPGLFTGSGRELAGELWWDDLGLGVDGVPATAWRSDDDPDLPTPRRHTQHKGSFGDVLVVGGAPGMSGAALLAARAAQAAGAGRVLVDLLDRAAAALDPQRPELMLRPGLATHAEPPLLARTTLVAGCGGGEAVVAVLPRLLACAGRLVLDADALNAISVDAALRQQLVARDAHRRETVVTPHPLEAARLLGGHSAEVQADRLGAAQALAEALRCCVLLKGSGSVIAAPGEAPRLNPTGNAALATAGTGDVLAGWLGGLWSQAGTAPGLARRCAVQAAWRHGRAADDDGRLVLRAADLVDALARPGGRRR